MKARELVIPALAEQRAVRSLNLHATCFLVLSDGLAAFRAFLKSEFCEENIEFWLACEDFKKTKSPQKLSSKARKIYTDFIEKEAPKEVRNQVIHASIN